ncbi:hypothetical protein GIY23_08320 [Allosaccharopolyspora coralli]|uniref:Asp23/Gls24 family envelope stress response protein n=1 Tax=Allosaccharopolyspora coralli TaxID=2665642 RepID=A0A5Q3QFD2_9PSEU|nr:hypothetical protein [Allosaccharopolyspora coralli]QGK69527.1 hypothetical protein GIY23_08320 [Allosaccharopolyspora coralli]
MAHSPENSFSLADRLAREVEAHPSVVRLDGRSFVATYLPGRRVEGIRANDPGEPVDVAVVVRLDRPLPEVIDEVRARVVAVAGDVPVNIAVADAVHVSDLEPGAGPP